MPVEFLGIAATSNGSEIQPRDGAAFDREYTLRLARAHEENGWDRVLFAYGSGAPDPNIGAAYIASKTETLQLLLAHRPNVAYPTFAAKTFATVDQVSGGRATVHFITGGTDHEQQREGDYLPEGRTVRAHPRVHGDRQAGVDVAGAVRPPRQALQVRRLRQRRLPRAAAPAPGVVRRILARRLPGRRCRGRHLLPVGRAAGAARPSRSNGSGRRPRRPGGPTCPRSRSPSARSSPRPRPRRGRRHTTSWTGSRRGSRRAAARSADAGRSVTRRTPGRSG